jgi:hypothetical protein
VEIEPTLETIRKYGTTDPLINGKIKILPSIRSRREEGYTRGN